MTSLLISVSAGTNCCLTSLPKHETTTYLQMLRLCSIIPRTNISAYLGSATYMESYEDKMPEGFMEKKPEMGGVSAVRINL